MKKRRHILFSLLIIGLLASPVATTAQCSICTRTAEQMGAKPAKGMNAGILYLAFTPIAIIGFVGYRWYKNEKESKEPQAW